MAQFTIYSSTDASAPVLSSESGKLVDVLDACLVNGYGAKAAAGWDIAYTGTSKRAYRAATGNRMYYRVQNDSISAALTFRGALVCGYESMSSVDVGARAFPMAFPVSYITWWLAYTANSTPIPWTVYADGVTAYVVVQCNLPTAASWQIYAMGEFTSYLATDNYNSILGGIIVPISLSGNPTVVDNTFLYINRSTVVGISDTTKAIPRGWTQLGVSPTQLVMTDVSFPGTNLLQYSVGFPAGQLNQYPSAGNLVVYPLELREITETGYYIPRGRLRGLFGWGHNIDFLAHGGNYTSTNGRTFQGLRPGYFYGAINYMGAVVVETSNTL